MTKPVFIVGTGRCGSTMMSDLVQQHPQMLSVSEFFANLGASAFLGDRLTGEEVCERIREPESMFSVVLGTGIRLDWVRYRFGEGARYKPADLPPIMRATLPLLTKDPESLLDELLAAVGARGEHPLADQYRFLLDWLKERFGRSVWVERSGASLGHVSVLARFFPGARFVHLCRDGRDTAVSMHKHPAFRLRLRYTEFLEEAGLDPFLPENTWGIDPFGPYLERKMARAFSREEFENSPVELAAMGGLWSRMIATGLDQLGQLPPRQVLTMRFEDVVSSPREELRRFARFVGDDFDSPEWLQTAAAIPRRTPSAWIRLPLSEQEHLARACAPGLKRLGYLSDDGR